MDQGETPDAAVRREIEEESGLILTQCRHAGHVLLYAVEGEGVTSLSLYVAAEYQGEVRGSKEGEPNDMTACDHPSFYKQAHSHLPEPQKVAPEWKVLLYVLTANENLWLKAAAYTRPNVNRFDWQEMLEREELSIVDRALVQLAASLCGSGDPVHMGRLCTSLDDHNFEVAIKAIRIKYDLGKGRSPL